MIKSGTNIFYFQHRINLGIVNLLFTTAKTCIKIDINSYFGRQMQMAVQYSDRKDFTTEFTLRKMTALLKLEWTVVLDLRPGTDHR